MQMEMFKVNPEPGKWMEPVETIYQSLGGERGAEKAGQGGQG